MRTNRSVRFGFCGLTVLQGSSEDQVSFNTTFGGDVLLKDNYELSISSLECQVKIQTHR